MLTVSIEDNGLTQRLTALVNRAKQIPPSTWDSIGDLVIKGIHQNYEISGLQVISGKLKNSPQIGARGDLFITVETPPKTKEFGYAIIQQLGGTIVQTVTEKQRRFFWAKHFEESGGFSKWNPESGMDTESKWKGMALSKKLTITIKPHNWFALQEQTKQAILQILSKYLLNGN